MNGEAPKQFHHRQMERLGQMLSLARELTGEHFKMGRSEARGLPCEIRTLKELSGQEVHAQEQVLADVARVEYHDHRFGRPHSIYRVNLQDHNILATLRESTVTFSPLMLYVLTHELIHVIRFAKMLVPFFLSDQGKTQEEHLVHTTTQQLLSKVPLPGVPEVLRRYRELCEQEDP